MMFDGWKLFFKGRSDELGKYLDVVMSVEGEISRAEARKLIELGKNIAPNTVMVEIGTYRGRSSIALAFGSLLGSHNRVYAIDPHVEFQGVFGGEFGPQDKAKLYRNLVKAGVGDIVAVVSLPSVAVARSWSERNVALLWIDGDHRYEGVRADFESWCPFLGEGGIIAFHDRSAGGVERLIRELTEEGRIFLVGDVGSLSWFERRGG